jgi:hypothetical protein
LEYSNIYKGKHRSAIDRKELTEKFLQLFASGGFLTKPPEYWQDGSRFSAFDKHVSYILDCFSKPWESAEIRKEYISSFSIDGWSGLSLEQCLQHTMSKCAACANNLFHLQKAFPTSPYYSPSPIVEVTIPPKTSECEVTRTALKELNKSYQTNFRHTFVHSALKVCGKSEGIERRKSAAEKKKEKRKWQQKLRDSINKSFSEGASLSFLAENESFAGYQRKRLLQCFEAKPFTRVKSHVPSDRILARYNDSVLDKLSLWPEDKTINWSELARQCNINGGNKGQIAKAIAQKNGVPLSRLDSKRRKSDRVSKKKLPGNEISIPSLPTLTAIREDISVMIEKGELIQFHHCLGGAYTFLASGAASF